MMGRYKLVYQYTDSSDNIHAIDLVTDEKKTFDLAELDLYVMSNAKGDSIDEAKQSFYTHIRSYQTPANQKIMNNSFGNIFISYKSNGEFRHIPVIYKDAHNLKRCAELYNQKEGFNNDLVRNMAMGMLDDITKKNVANRAFHFMTCGLASTIKSYVDYVHYQDSPNDIDTIEGNIQKLFTQYKSFRDLWNFRYYYKYGNDYNNKKEEENMKTITNNTVDNGWAGFKKDESDYESIGSDEEVSANKEDQDQKVNPFVEEKGMVASGQMSTDGFDEEVSANKEDQDQKVNPFVEEKGMVASEKMSTDTDTVFLQPDIFDGETALSKLPTDEEGRKHAKVLGLIKAKNK